MSFFSNKRGCYPILSVHDEVGYIVSFDRAMEIIPKALRIMEDLDFSVPMTAGIDIGLNWGEKHECTLETVEKTLKKLKIKQDAEYATNKTS